MRAKVKILFVFAIMMLSAGFSSGNELHDRIRQEVLDLKYPESVADDFVKMVSNWEDPKGRFVFQLLNKETEERKILGLLGQEIKQRISYEKDCFDLAQIIEKRRANCFGYTQLYYVLGRALGLDTSTVRLTSDYDHIANIVRLSNNTMIVVDLIRPKYFISEDIIVDGSLGNWAYVSGDKNRITRNGRTINILGEKELLAEIYFCQGTVCYLAGQVEKTIPFFTKAIEFNPKCARAYNNRGGAHLMLGEHTEAIFDFNKAIDLDPKYASAYNNRASAYLDSGQYSKAVVDYKKAIELDQKLDKARKGLELAEKALTGL